MHTGKSMKNYAKWKRKNGFYLKVGLYVPWPLIIYTVGPSPLDFLASVGTELNLLSTSFWCLLTALKSFTTEMRFTKIKIKIYINLLIFNHNYNKIL